MICGGKATEGMTVKEVITVHNLKQAMQFMLVNLDRPVDLNTTGLYVRACVISRVRSEATR